MTCENGRVGQYEDSSVRGDICSFLEYLYEGVAETLPDFRDELGAASTVEVSVDDPYATQLNRPAEAVLSEMVPKQKKPRKNKRQVVINQSRTGIEERWLPPGTMKEYYDQYVLQSSLSKPGSFPSFWRVALTPAWIFPFLIVEPASISSGLPFWAL